LTRNQKITLVVLAILDLVVIVGLGSVVVNGMRNASGVAVTPAEVGEVTATLFPTWTPTVTSTPVPTLLPPLTRTPRPTRTPLPTYTPRPTPTPGPVSINNPDFDFLMPNRIPGWEWDADVNYRSGDEYHVQYSYAEPMFAAADDPARRIDDSTLKVETVRWVKFRAWAYQTVTVTPESLVYFKIKANAFSSIDRLIIKAGVDPNGGDGCEDAQWGEILINQDDGIETVASPRVVVGEEGRVTICFFAEPRYPDINNAAFFDQAELIAVPPN